MPSRYMKHKEKWINCTRCELCENRKKVCLLRGKVPCDMLFVGEAPGPRITAESTIIQLKRIMK